jgi:hypothetical protein
MGKFWLAVLPGLYKKGVHHVKPNSSRWMPLFLQSSSFAPLGKVLQIFHHTTTTTSSWCRSWSHLLLPLVLLDQEGGDLHWAVCVHISKVPFVRYWIGLDHEESKTTPTMFVRMFPMCEIFKGMKIWFLFSLLASPRLDLVVVCFREKLFSMMRNRSSSILLKAIYGCLIQPS